jgi:hypothetical protein
MSGVGEQLYAAHRKIRIAQDEHDRLKWVLHRCGRPAQSPIAVQSAFEAVLFAAAAAADKLGEAIRLGLSAEQEREIRKPPRHYTPLGWALEQAPEEVPFDALREWIARKTVAHARKLRNHATHDYYEKGGGPHGGYVVNDYISHATFGSVLVQSITAAVVTDLDHLFKPIDALAQRFKLDHSDWDERFEREGPLSLWTLDALERSDSPLAVAGAEDH